TFTGRPASIRREDSGISDARAILADSGDAVTFDVVIEFLDKPGHVGRDLTSSHSEIGFEMMNMKTKATRVICAMALTGLIASAQAASVSVVYTGSNDVGDDGAVMGVPGEVLTFDLVMDFSDRITLGGGFDVTWNSGGLTFVEYASAGLGDPNFGRDPVLQNGRLFNGAVGNFNGLTVGTIATISFTIVGTPGLFLIRPSGTDGDSGPWIDGVTFVDTIIPDYNSAAVRVIPVPAAVWFLLSGLAALFGFRRSQAI
ncbi:MAG: VPLPA-CTERM sorting domain-containing protein, partial [Gammaproteobacteria bacterium]